MRKIKENQNNSQVKNYIFTALILLMEQNDYQSITVTDIAKKAGVSRMTYYRTYSSKEDILIQYFNDTASKLLAEIKSCPDITLYQLAVSFFTFFQEHGSIVPLLKKANLLETLFDNFIHSLQHFYIEIIGRTKIDSLSNYHLHYSAGGISLVLLLWIENGYKETPEEMALLITSFMTPPPGQEQLFPDNDH